MTVRILIFFALFSAIFASNLKKVPRQKACNGARVTDFLYQDCDDKKRSCITKTSEMYHQQINFKFKNTHPSFNLNVTTVVLNQKYDVMNHTFTGPYEADKEYKIEFAWTIPDKGVGWTVTIKNELSDEICFTYPIKIIAGKSHSEKHKVTDPVITPV